MITLVGITPIFLIVNFFPLDSPTSVRPKFKIVRSRFVLGGSMIVTSGTQACPTNLTENFSSFKCGGSSTATSKIA